jgi:hypothetical protein
LSIPSISVVFFTITICRLFALALYSFTIIEKLELGRMIRHMWISIQHSGMLLSPDVINFHILSNRTCDNQILAGLISDGGL